jgi:Holliday junction DNA helicase RuvB
MNILRPRKFDDIVGQNEVKKILKIAITSAQIRKDTLGHLIFSTSSPGVGKTTFAQCIANELGVRFNEINAASIKNVKDITPLLFKLEYGDILFIDEAHNLKRKVQEFLYVPMEDYSCVFGSGEELTKIDLPKFTLIAATTNFGSLEKPFRDRFKHNISFSCYNQSDLAKLALLNATKLQVEIDEEGANEIAKRCRNTPRILNRYLEWCRDFSINRSKIFNSNNNHNKITITDITEAMNLAKIDENGYTLLDRKYIICLKGAGIPLALNTISSILKVDEKTLENEVEPFLLTKGLIIKTTKGRMYCDPIKKKEESCSKREKL